ncbi:Putative Maintenance of mitochondrial morphology protein 1 [Rhizopus microsporus]|nr:Putative Maintenance of mitochondrial morphology protein 1 [Rhizopus microsporus]
MSDSLNTTQLIDLIETQLARSACSKSSTVSFVKGFILGQLSVIIVMILVLRYLFTEDVKRVKKRYIPSRPSSNTVPSVASAAAALPNDHVTLKTYYDVIHHPPESTDWLNVLLAQVILQYRQDANINNRLSRSLDRVLNGGVLPSFVGPIHVTELNLGQEFPIFSRARIRPSDEVGSMRAEIDFEYNDQVTLGIETQLILNWPRQAFAVLPVSLVLSVARFSGTLTIELMNPPETTTKPKIPIERYIAISSYSDFILDLQVQSLIGSKTKLEDIPKLTDLIQTKLRNMYIDKLVYPQFLKVKVPNMWKQEEEEEEEEEEESTKDSMVPL